MATEKETLLLTAAERGGTGSRHARRLRNNGLIPCVLYGEDIQPHSLKVNRHELEMIIAHHSGENVIFDLVIDGKSMPNVLLKDLQRDPITDHAVHADLLKISMTRKLRVMVTIRLTGEPAGVAQQGGILEHQTRSVEVECLPGDIVKEFVLDVSALNIDDRLFVRDIPVDPKTTILTPGDTVIASVHMPKLEEEAKPSEAEAEEKAEEEGEEKKEAAGDETAKTAEEEKGKDKDKQKDKEN